MEREGLRPQMLNAKNHQREAEIIAQAGRRGAITLATNMAGRGVDIILGGNPSTKEEQEEIRALGGLHVIGTERHESRRIDNQLRGRAGRQGDPGSSQFFVSTEDDLMRIFGGDRMKNLMQTLRVPDDLPIENKMISKSIESAQKKVEGNHFDSRKHLVEYDDVINKHRIAIYERRREVIDIAEGVTGSETKSLGEIIKKLIAEELQFLVNFHTAGDDQESWNLQEIYETVRTIWSPQASLLEQLQSLAKGDEDKGKIRTKIIDYLYQEAQEIYDSLTDRFAQAGIDFKEVEKGMLIRAIDQHWVEHLEAIDYLRQGIGLRGYGQRDPLVEYKKEAWRLYQELNNLVNKHIVYGIYHTADGLSAVSAEVLQAFANKNQAQQLEFSGAQKEMHKQAGERNTFDLVTEKLKDESGKKVGRNDLCPCGSGKKYKKCHGK